MSLDKPHYYPRWDRKCFRVDQSEAMDADALELKIVECGLQIALIQRRGFDSLPGIGDHDSENPVVSHKVTGWWTPVVTQNAQDDDILDLIGGGQLQGCHDHSPLDELASKLVLL